MIIVTAGLLIFGGAGILVAALFPIRKLIPRLPKGGFSQKRWYLLMGLTVLFILGYLAFGFLSLGATQSPADLIVPLIFFFGAVFVWLSAVLALQTVIDVRQATMLEQVTETDELTGLFNRRYLERRMNEELARAERFNRPLTILYVNLDHFSAVNDGYGRATGDTFLASFGQMLMGAIRNNDVIARYGDDRFIIIAVNTPVLDACRLAERIIDMYKTEVVHGLNERKRPITLHLSASIGLACYCEAARGIQGLIHNAEEAMHEAKASGGGCYAASKECLAHQPA